MFVFGGGGDERNLLLHTCSLHPDCHFSSAEEFSGKKAGRSDPGLLSSDELVLCKMITCSFGRMMDVCPLFPLLGFSGTAEEPLILICCLDRG